LFAQCVAERRPLNRLGLTTVNDLSSPPNSFDAAVREQDRDEPLDRRLRAGLWEFAFVAGPLIAAEMRFEARGRIAGHAHRNEARWRVHDDCLEFVSAAGAVATRFDRREIGGDGRLALTGRFLGEADSEVFFSLRELERRPIGLGVGVSPRRNLVVMRAGDAALFPQWTPTANRSWDLAISFYGAGTPNWGQEYFIPAKGPKWQPVHAWLAANREILGRYDYFWFPDDDIMTTWENVNEFFEVIKTAPFVNRD